MRRRAPSASLLLLAVLPGAASAQQPGAGDAEGWNRPRVLELVDRARDRRRQPAADSALRNYRADATGHIYFFLDREGEGEPVLLRADQVALELYWAQPGRVRQIIRGMRSEEQFPIKDFAYYLDRYTVIQNGFGDEIRVGEGRDVRDVPHPLAPGAEAVYDYRLSDSTTIRLPGRADPLRVYEIQVRPGDFDRAAIVGSLFIERARADLVRLAFTFTPAAYLDPRNERVEIALENALWEERYWLPREQRLLVRRELPELDLDVGTVIRAVLRVTDYELNVRLPVGFFSGSGVVFAAGPDGLAAYDFPEGLYDGLEDVGLAPGAEAGTLDAVDVEAIAGRILRERYLRGVPRFRFYAADASSVLRYDRAEGLVTGLGWSFGAGEQQVDVYGAYQWGAERPVASAGLRPLGDRPGLSLEAYFRRPVDLGLRPAAAGVVSSIAAAGFGDDYRDPYFASGATAAWTTALAPGRRLRLDARAEWHDSADPAGAASTAPLDRDAAFRPVVTVRPTQVYALGAALSFERETFAGGAERGSLRVEGGYADGAFGAVEARVGATWRGAALRWGLDAGAVARVAADPPHPRLLGGRGTLPGHPFRAHAAESAALLDAQLWRSVVRRWVRVHVTGAAGAWRVPGGGDVLAAGSIGLGVGLVDGILRLDYAVPLGQDTDGLDDGVLFLSIDPRLWPFL